MKILITLISPVIFIWKPDEGYIKAGKLFKKKI